MEYEFDSSNPRQTEKLAEQLASQLKGGEIIELAGDVGAGKTTFVRGLARGMGSQDRVSSPTFTISKVYNSKNISLHHFDFYRLDDLEVIKKQLTETISDPKNSVVLEWANEVRGDLLTDHMQVKITVTGDESRTLRFNLPKSYQHIRIEQ